MIPFYPTLFLNLFCLGIEVFFAFLHFSYWIKQRSNKNHLFLFFWFTAAILHSSTRILQYLSAASSIIVFDAKVGAITNYLIVWISINFISTYTNYTLKKYEKLIWFFVLVIPVLTIIFSEYYIGNLVRERHTIFSEVFYGATTGKYYPIFGVIRPISFLILFYRLLSQKNVPDKSWFVVAGFFASVLFAINDTIAIYFELTWLRLNDFSYVFLGVGYTLAMVQHYNKLYNDMEFLVVKRMEELSRSEELYRKLVTTVPDLIVRTDLEGNILFINETVFPFIKSIPTENLLGKNILSFVAAEDREKMMNNLLQMVDGPLGLQEYRLAYNNEYELYCEVNGEMLRDIDGDPFGMVFVLRDVTERKQTEEMISSSLKEKEVLLKEIYHRTKNNMQVICSIIGLQTPQLKDKDAANILKETENRIFAMSLVHQKLYQSNNLSRIDLKTYITDLSAQLKSSYELNARGIEIKLELESVGVLIDTAIPVGLIINELVTNSIKYAFPNSSRGEIKINLQSRNGEILLSIKDNGIGIAGDFNIAESKTLGLKILYELVSRQLNGKIEMNASNGVCCLVSFNDSLYTERV